MMTGGSLVYSKKTVGTIELPQAEIQDFQTQHSGGMMALAPLLLPLLKKVGLLPELPPSFQAISRQNALTHTHTQNRQLPQRHHSPLFILLKKILLSRYHLVVVDGMTHKTHNIFWGQMNDFVVSRTCPKLGHIFQKRSRTQSGMR